MLPHRYGAFSNHMRVRCYTNFHTEAFGTLGIRLIRVRGARLGERRAYSFGLHRKRSEGTDFRFPLFQYHVRPTDRT